MQVANHSTLRIWDELRTSHLELLQKMSSGTVVYRTTNYSFHPESIGALKIQKAGRARTAWILLTTSARVIELNEPTMFRIWPHYLLHCAILALKKRVSRRPPVIVLYAIDNFVPRFAAKFPFGGTVLDSIYRRVLRQALKIFDRIAFGSDGAREAYEPFLPGRGLIHRVIPQLPSPCDCGERTRTPRTVLFASTFEDRKGVRELINAWDVVEDDSLRLTLIGKGPLHGVVEAWAEGKSSVAVVVDPPREEIHRAFRTASVAVLLSQPARFWREQIGLPIVEGLAHGCVIVATDQSGIAGWLKLNGHYAVAAGEDAESIAETIVRATHDRRTASQITASLPLTHTRIAADEWMCEE